MSILGALLGGALLLIWPAFLNGYPIQFVDTIAYLLHTITGEAPWDKTQVYGPFLLLFHGGISLWGAVLAQGAILSALLWLVQRVAVGEALAARHMVLCLSLALLTTGPWFVATIMPDFFTPIVALCLFLLGFGEKRLSGRERLAVGLIGTLAIAVHLSHLPVALALVVLVVLVRRQWRPVLRVATPMLAAMLLLVATNLYSFGRATLSPHGAVFMLARLQADGSAVRTLRDNCPQSGWYLCDFIDRMPMNSDTFLWDPTSPPARDAAGNPRPGGAAMLAPEARTVVAATLRDYPWMVAKASVANAFEQVFKARLGDTFDPTDLDEFATRVLARGFPPAERARFEASAQMRGDLGRYAAPFIRLHQAVLIVTTLAALAAWWRLWRRSWRGPEDAPLLGLVLCMMVAVAANAFATGALSAPHLRYGARIAWLLPLAAALAWWPWRARLGAISSGVTR